MPFKQSPKARDIHSSIPLGKDDLNELVQSACHDAIIGFHCCRSILKTVVKNRREMSRLFCRSLRATWNKEFQDRHLHLENQLHFIGLVTQKVEYGFRL